LVIPWISARRSIISALVSLLWVLAAVSLVITINSARQSPRPQ
jgi:hypothetical protein